MIRPLRRGVGDATEVEWKWLTAAPGHNPFIGFGDRGVLTTHRRLRELWKLHQRDIRRLWQREGTPAELPYGHPASVEGWTILGDRG